MAPALLEIGTSLAEARVLQGLSLDDVQAETRIRSRYLAAMEDERFDELPGHGYAKCFLRSYADFLGLDGPATVASYRARYEQVEPAVPVTQVRARGPRRWEPLGLLGLGLVAAAGVAFLGVRLAGSDGPAPRAATTAPAAETSAAAPAPSEPVASTAAGAPGPVLVLTAREPCWLEVRLGGPRGKGVWTGTLQPGRRLRLGLRRPVWILAGAPDALHASIGSRAAPLPPGVARLVATARGLRAAS